jgi:hypothetical protein
VLEYGTYHNFVNKILEKREGTNCLIKLMVTDMYNRHSGVITTDWATSELTRSIVTVSVCIEWGYMHIIVIIIIIIIILIN